MKCMQRLMTVLVIAGILSVLIPEFGLAAVITSWNFNTIGIQAAPYNSPAPTTGTGTAISLGMTNNVNGGNTTSDDVLNVAGTTTPSFNENMWRIRGTANNGWYTHAAAVDAGDTNAEQQYSQGIELDASTAGYSNIQFSFDWYCTAQGIRDLQFQYNTNVANAAGWTNFGGTSPTGTYTGSDIGGGDFYNPTSPPGTISVDLSSIAAANNDPNFGIRLVSAFDSTGNVPGDYASNALDSNGHTVLYNNSSGNWRFDNLTFSGTAVPEPSSLMLAGIGIVSLLVSARRRVAN